MILSNEPGYYKTDGFGIRIENLELVVGAEIAGAEKPMNAFETLTLAPIDRRLIDSKMLSAEELGWLNEYHARVRHEVRPHVDEATKLWLDAATAALSLMAENEAVLSANLSMTRKSGDQDRFSDKIISKNMSDEFDLPR